MRHDTKPPFDQLETRNGVCVADGWGIRINVRQGHLIVEDGIGQSRRTRRYHKATSGLDRLVIIGHSGYQTFEAVRWLSDAKIHVIHLDSDGRVLSVAAQGQNNPALRRAQAWAATTQVGVEVIRYLLTLKVQGQNEAANRLGVQSDEIDAALNDIKDATNLDILRSGEVRAAVAYWQTWTEVEIQFVKADQKRIPNHWRTVGQRRSPQTASGRRAINPINAIFNYLYALLEAEARIATIAVGLDPGLGILHLDKPGRDSFGLDLMEAVRPQVDAYVLDLIESHHFKASDFHDIRSGICRIARPLAHQLSETTLLWRNNLAVPAEAITRLLSGTPGANIGKITTPVTQSNRRAAKGSTWSIASSQRPHLDRNCQRCGDSATDGGKLCARCRQKFQSDAGWLKAGRMRLASMRDRGVDPAHGGQAADKRGRTNRQHQNDVADWNAQNDRPPKEVFESTILPAIKEVSLKEMRAATGLSIDYCSKIRRGLKVPHPRHWDSLRLLAAHVASRADR